jgi:osmotically-inducible protein OsmY
VLPQDQDLQQAVTNELARDPSLAADHISVTIHDGVVTLSGHVATLAERHAAEAAAIRVKGVKAVVDELEVRITPEAAKSDEALAAAAVERLAWNTSVPKDAVKVVVEDGHITLSGEVDRSFQRDAAEHDVRKLEGAVGVTNHIAVKAGPVAETVSDDIMHALHRSWFFDPHTINVTVEGGTVRLTGTVRSPHERQLAAETAWAEPGVVEVENQIAIAID